MSDNGTHNLSLILDAVGKGEPGAEERLFRVVYEELRRMAHRRVAFMSMETNSMVHETYLRLVGKKQPGWDDRRHFFGAAVRAMRFIAVDHERKRQALRRGGDRRRVTLDENVGEEPKAVDLLDLDRALDQLAEELPRHASIVEHRFFLGLTVDETAELLGVSARTVAADWVLAKSWLKRQMSPGPADPD